MAELNGERQITFTGLKIYFVLYCVISDSFTLPTPIFKALVLASFGNNR